MYMLLMAIMPIVQLGFGIYLLCFGRALIRRLLEDAMGRCPACQYSVKGVPAGLCPECGYAIDRRSRDSTAQTHAAKP
jgi:rRNA maturation endonuclease Nob1